MTDPVEGRVVLGPFVGQFRQGLGAATELHSDIFLNTEPVLQSVDLVPGRFVQHFGQTDVWDLNAWERNANLSPSSHRLRFHTAWPAWNLRLREIAMVMLNPCHPQVRHAGIFLPMAPAAVSTIRSVIEVLRILAAWAHEEGLSEDPSTWTERDLDRFIASRKGSHSAKYYKAIRCLHKYRAVLTYGGLDSEPWLGASVEALSGNRSSSKKIKTAAIPPAVWWPLLRASWRYIHVFAGDILKARSRWEELNEPGTPAGPAHRDLLREWLDEPSNVIPLHAGRHHADKSQPQPMASMCGGASFCSWLAVARQPSCSAARKARLHTLRKWSSPRKTPTGARSSISCPTPGRWKRRLVPALLGLRTWIREECGAKPLHYELPVTCSSQP